MTMPRGQAKCRQEKSSKAGETESGEHVAALGAALPALLRVAEVPRHPLPWAALLAVPALSPAHCSCGSGRCLPTRRCSGGGVPAGGGGS